MITNEKSFYVNQSDLVRGEHQYGRCNPGNRTMVWVQVCGQYSETEPFSIYFFIPITRHDVHEYGYEVNSPMIPIGELHIFLPEATRLAMTRAKSYADKWDNLKE